MSADAGSPLGSRGLTGTIQFSVKIGHVRIDQEDMVATSEVESSTFR
jgi:hypothetical protein